MDLEVFYGVVSATGFTLTGLWWNAVDKHPEWKVHGDHRRLAGGVYLSFLLPALMSLFAQVNPGNPYMWRISFGVAALVGILVTARLLQVTGHIPHGLFRRVGWLAPVLYGAVFLLTVAPELARWTGLTPLQLVAVALVLLIVLGHGLTWEFLMEAPAEGAADRGLPRADGAVVPPQSPHGDGAGWQAQPRRR